MAQELTEEELAELKAQEKMEEENKKIEENFDAYSELDANQESQKIQDSVLNKHLKRAVSYCLVKV